MRVKWFCFAFTQSTSNGHTNFNFRANQACGSADSTIITRLTYRMCWLFWTQSPQCVHSNGLQQLQIARQTICRGLRRAIAMCEASLLLGISSCETCANWKPIGVFRANCRVWDMFSWIWNPSSPDGKDNGRQRKCVAAGQKEIWHALTVLVGLKTGLGLKAAPFSL